MIQAHVFISGLVQRVGFRAYIRSSARKLHLTGWTQNLSDGRVEAILQGEKHAIEKLIHLCNRGPFLAEVERVVVIWEESGPIYESFVINK